jgi:hypothetical protein
MKAKQHSGVRRMPVPGKKCARYITRSEKRNRDAEKKLRQFLCDFYGDETLAKKAFAQIKGRGLGELEMFIITDSFEEWLPAGWPEAKKKRARLNWKKALSEINENRQEKKRTETDHFLKSFGPSSYSQARRKS